MPNYWTQCCDYFLTGWNPEEVILNAVSIRGLEVIYAGL